jgi:hypothetical protein
MILLDWFYGSCREDVWKTLCQPQDSLIRTHDIFEIKANRGTVSESVAAPQNLEGTPSGSKQAEIWSAAIPEYTSEKIIYMTSA